MSVQPPEESSYTLNYDVTVIILKQLPLHDVINMRRVCKDLKYYIDEYFKTFHILSIFPFDLQAVQDGKAHGYQLNRLSNIRQSMNLDMDSIVRNRVPVHWEKIEDEENMSTLKLPLPIAQFFPNVTQLYVMNIFTSTHRSVKDFWPRSLNKLITSFPELKKLAIAHIDGKSLHACIESLNNLKSLETLIILSWNDVFMPRFKKEFLQQLKHLYLPDLHQQSKLLDEMKVESIAVHIDDIQEHSSQTIECLVPEKYPNLKHVALPLSLFWNEKGTLHRRPKLFIGLRELFKANKTIESIQLYDSFIDIVIPEDPSFSFGHLFSGVLTEACVLWLRRFPELKTVQITMNNAFEIGITGFLWMLASNLPSFTNIEEIHFNIDSCEGLGEFVHFLKSLAKVSGGSVKKIVLQSILINCHKTFPKILPPNIAYEIEIIPAKHCICHIKPLSPDTDSIMKAIRYLYISD